MALSLILIAKIHAEDYSFRGKHFIASYLGCDEEAMKNNAGLKNALLDAAKASYAQVLDHVEYEFTPQGFTMAVLLSESHATIHTYPEHNACFVDLFTCGEKCSSANFDAAMRAYLKPKEIEISELIRSEQHQFLKNAK